MSGISEFQQAVVPQGYIQTKIVTLSTTATTFTPIYDLRARWLLQNTSSATVWIGGSSISTANAWFLPPNGDLALPIGRDVVIFGQAGSTVQVIQMELR